MDVDGLSALPADVALSLRHLLLGDRAPAWLEIDADLVLVGLGGALENYGLAGLRVGASAVEQAFFLEGLLPLPESPFIFPEVELTTGRAADLHFYDREGSVWIVLLDVTATREQARRMQQKAYDMTLLQEREALLNRQLEAANAALRVSQHELETSRAALQCVHDRLQHELTDAEQYVRSLLPAPMTEPFTTDWRFVSSTELGGDAFGYHWIDPDHFALYLLDVCGHGVGPCLLSVAVLHSLQAGSLRDIDFRDPRRVMAALNNRYQMERATDLYFTLWYGVFRPATRELDYCCAGHPPALLIERGQPCIRQLKAKGLPIGMMPDIAYARETVTIPPESAVYLLSDGAFEVERPDGSMLTFDEFLAVMAEPVAPDQSELDRLYQRLVTLRGDAALDDDFSIVRFNF